MTQHEELPDGSELVRWESDASHAKDAWGDGPWIAEPDLVEWRRPGSPLPRLVIRNAMGSLCGYVGLPPGHPLHGGDMFDSGVSSLDVHGGVTYTAACAGHICHVPREGEPEHVWWLGFDCSHSGDLAPGLVSRLRQSGSWDTFGDSYRTLAYVIAQTERLAEQLT